MIIVAALLAAVLIPVAIVLVRVNRKRLHIVRCAEAAPSEDIEAICSQIDCLGTETPIQGRMAKSRRGETGDADPASDPASPGRPAAAPLCLVHFSRVSGGRRHGAAFWAW